MWSRPLILFLGVAAVRSMPTDIFSGNTHSGGHCDLAIPPVSPRRRWKQRVTTYSQYSISSNVKRHQETWKAQTLNGLSIQKISFQPDVNLDLAIAQIVSATNAIRALMPPGIQPPIVVQFQCVERSRPAAQSSIRIA